MRNYINFRVTLVMSSGILMGLAGCTSNDYRCPLDPDKDPQSSTACVSMDQALAGSKSTLRSKNSVVVDDSGKPFNYSEATSSSQSLVQRMPLAQMGGEAGNPDFSQAPVFHSPKVFQVWTPPQIDDRGVYHEGRNSWLATSGKWQVQSKGTGYRPDVSAQTQLHTSSPSAAGGISNNNSTLLRPSIPQDEMQSKYWVKPKAVAAPAPAKVDAPIKAATPTKSAASEKAQKSASLGSFGSALVDGAKGQPKGTDVVTAPAVSLKD